MKKDIFKPVDRFDLEQCIMNCWQVTDDIDILTEHVLERDLDVDTISNALIGMKTIYQMKFEKCFEVFEQCIRNDAFSKDRERFSADLFKPMTEEQLSSWPFSTEAAPSMTDSDQDVTISLGNIDLTTSDMEINWEKGFEHNYSFSSGSMDDSPYKSPYVIEPTDNIELTEIKLDKLRDFEEFDHMNAKRS